MNSEFDNAPLPEAEDDFMSYNSFSCDQQTGDAEETEEDFINSCLNMNNNCCKTSHSKATFFPDSIPDSVHPLSLHSSDSEWMQWSDSSCSPMSVPSAPDEDDDDLSELLRLTWADGGLCKGCNNLTFDCRC